MNAKHFLAGAGLLLSACVTTGAGGSGDSDFASCPAYAPAYKTTDTYMAGFNSRDSAAWGATLHFPHVRIASGRIAIINAPSDLNESFDRLIAQGWDHSAWAGRRIVQCEATKAHMLTTFIRYRADNTVLSQFNSLYIVELKDGKWGITARSSFAP